MSIFLSLFPPLCHSHSPSLSLPHSLSCCFLMTLAMVYKIFLLASFHMLSCYKSWFWLLIAAGQTISSVTFHWVVLSLISPDISLSCLRAICLRNPNFLVGRVNRTRLGMSVLQMQKHSCCAEHSCPTPSFPRPSSVKVSEPYKQFEEIKGQTSPTLVSLMMMYSTHCTFFIPELRL